MSWLLQRIASYAKARLLEASTWRNLILLIVGTWASAHPEIVSALVPICLALAGAIGTLFPDLLATRKEGNADETRNAPSADRSVRLRVPLPADSVDSPARSESNAVDSGWNG